MSVEDDNMAKFMAAFGDRQVTDEDGQPVESDEGTFESEPATDEAEVEAETFEDDSTEGENPVDEESDTQTDEIEDEKPVEEDSRSGVPVDRFKKVYGKAKTLEREKEALERRLQELEQSSRPIQPPADPNTALELELLYDKYPQFNQQSEKYSRLLDEMGAEIYATSGGSITRLEAARRAIARQNEIAKQVGTTRADNTQAKRQIADNASVSSSASRGTRSTSPNLDDMSDKEIEAYMKANGMW